MCGGKPSVPDNSAQIEEQKRQFELEQARLREEMAAREKEAERQRYLEQLRYEEQMRIQREQQAAEAQRREQERQLLERQQAEAQARWEAEQRAIAQQREFERQQYAQQQAEAQRLREIEAQRYAQQQAEAQRLREIEAQRYAQQQQEAERQRLLQQQQYEAQLAEQARQRALAEEQVRQQKEAAAARQRAIDEATTGINQNFDRFNDAYFDQFQKDFIGYYTPEVDRQLTEARKQAEFSLARRGLTDSAAAADLYGRITETEAQRRADIARQAAEQAQTLRNQVNNQRAMLLSQATAAGGGRQFVDAASGYTVQAPDRTALGDLFAGLVDAGNPSGTQVPTATPLAGGDAAAPDGAAAPTGANALTLVGANGKQAAKKTAGTAYTNLPLTA